MKFEEDFSNHVNPKYNIALLIPLLFNHVLSDSFPLSLRENVFEQFGLHPPYVLDYENNPEYLRAKRLYDSLIYVGKTKKIRNEYLRAHPELLNLHI